MKDVNVSLFDVIMSLPGVIDMVSPELEGHHKRVAYIALNIAAKMGLPVQTQNDLFLAALLHDCGALSLKERLNALQFDIEGDRGIFNHTETGWRLLKTFKPLEKAAHIVRYHHTSWNKPEYVISSGLKAPEESFILHLADRVDVIAGRHQYAASQAENVKGLVKKESGEKFMPDAVDAFLSLSESRSFWTDVMNAPGEDFRKQNFTDIELDINGVFGVAKFIEKIIDFRSRFTATHSSGVSAVAEELARIAGLNEKECTKIKIAGYLHDLGKLAIPVEILEKPDRLTKEEFNIVKKHTFYSYHILKNIKGLEEINHFASFHHERLNGKGYPFGLTGDKLSQGSRIMCVADVFTAITEDRPYRKGMDSQSALKVLQNMADNEDIDAYLAECLKSNYDRINEVRINAQLAAEKEYEEFLHPNA